MTELEREAERLIAQPDPVSLEDRLAQLAAMSRVLVQLVLAQEEGDPCGSS